MFGSAVGGVQFMVSMGLLLLSLGVKGFALVEALRYDANAYVAAGKRTKNLWLAVTGIALAVDIVILAPLSFLNIAGFIAAAVFLADVRPALRAVSGKGGSASGPYGPW